MSQNLVSVSFSPAQLSTVDDLLSQLEMQFSELIALTPDQRRSATKMGPKSETFCRQTLSLLDQNPGALPPGLSMAEAKADLASIDELRPRLQRLARLSERASDTECALGNGVMRAALDGYAMLKIVGRNHGLDALRQSLGARFARSPKKVDVAVAA